MSGCSEAGCDAEVLARGLCARHYRASRRDRLQVELCTAPGCKRAQFCRLLCRGHYARALRGRPVEGRIQDISRGNRILSIRLPSPVVARLEAQAREEGTTANRVAVRLILASLASLAGQGSPA